MLDLTRHIELFDAEKFNKPVHVIGVGATGSWVVLQLASLGITDITVWDYDVIEEHNIANQAYDLSHIGQPKVEALLDVVKRKTGTVIKTKNEKYIDQRLSGIVFLMVDSMAERKRIWEKSIRMKHLVTHLIEPRMGLDVGRVYNVNPTDLTHIREYEASYYGDYEAEVSACGASMTVITTAMSIASWCVRQVINLNAGVELDNEILLDFMYNNIITKQW